MIKYNIDDKGAWFKINDAEYVIPNTDKNFHTIVGIILYSGYSDDQKKKLITDQLSDVLVSKYIDPSLIKTFGISGEKVYNGIPLYKLSQQIREFIDAGVKDSHIMTMVEATRNPALANLAKEGFTGYHISTDGNLLFYKGIRDNWLDVFSGTIRNSLGKIIEMARDKMIPGYGPGLYVSNWKHASAHGPKVVLVKVKPEDIFQVMGDKLKVTKYKVLKVVTEPLTDVVIDLATVIKKKES